MEIASELVDEIGLHSDIAEAARIRSRAAVAEAACIKKRPIWVEGCGIKVDDRIFDHSGLVKKTPAEAHSRGRGWVLLALIVNDRAIYH